MCSPGPRLYYFHDYILLSYSIIHGRGMYCTFTVITKWTESLVEAGKGGFGPSRYVMYIGGWVGKKKKKITKLTSS